MAVEVHTHTRAFEAHNNRTVPLPEMFRRLVLPWGPQKNELGVMKIKMSMTSFSGYRIIKDPQTPQVVVSWVGLRFDAWVRLRFGSHHACAIRIYLVRTMYTPKLIHYFFKAPKLTHPLPYQNHVMKCATQRSTCGAALSLLWSMLVVFLSSSDKGVFAQNPLSPAPTAFTPSAVTHPTLNPCAQFKYDCGACIESSSLCEYCAHSGVLSLLNSCQVKSSTAGTLGETSCSGTTYTTVATCPDRPAPVAQFPTHPPSFTPPVEEDPPNKAKYASLVLVPVAFGIGIFAVRRWFGCG
jgi:hypothetical protein